MRCLVQRDMRSNECFLIANSLPYVEFSHTPRIANVKGSTVAKKQVDNESENIKGAFKNYVAQFLPYFDHLTTDKSNQNGTHTNKHYWNESTLNWDKIH